MKSTSFSLPGFWRAFVECLPRTDDFASRYIYRWIGFPIFILAALLRLKANHVTVLSLAIAIGAAWAFVQGQYASDVLGVLLLNLALGCDSVDGQVARYRKEASDFGRWFDSVSDVIKLIAVMIGISYGTFIRQQDTLYLLLGMAGLSHLFMSYYLMVLNKRFSFYRFTNAVNLTTNRWLGLESSLYLFFSAFLLLGAPDLLLKVFSVAGVGPWALLAFRAWQSSRTN